MISSGKPISLQLKEPAPLSIWPLVEIPVSFCGHSAIRQLTDLRGQACDLPPSPFMTCSYPAWAAVKTVVKHHRSNMIHCAEGPALESSKTLPFLVTLSWPHQQKYMRQVKEILRRTGEGCSFYSVCGASMVAADPDCTTVYHGKWCVTDGISKDWPHWPQR